MSDQSNAQPAATPTSSTLSPAKRIEAVVALCKRRGFVFDDDSVIMKNGKLRAIYLKDDIAGFAVHLLQK